MRRIFLRALLFAIIAGSWGAGCGYRVASRNRIQPQWKTLAIVPLENETTTVAVEQILTRSLFRTFVEKTGFRMVRDPDRADAVLRGSVFRLSANPVLFGRSTFGNTFLVTLRARIEIQDRETGRELFRNDNYVFREQYVINIDVENFFSELNPALERIAGDFAASIVTTVLEDF